MFDKKFGSVLIPEDLRTLDPVKPRLDKPGYPLWKREIGVIGDSIIIDHRNKIFLDDSAQSVNLRCTLTMICDG